MSIPPPDAPADGAAAPGNEDELSRLRERVAVLERELASHRDPKRGSSQTEFQAALYEAMMYGLARTLSLYDPASVRILVREMGRRIREYLEEIGYCLGSARTLHETVGKITSFFVEHGFADIEIVESEADMIHARWRRLLGFRAYERIAATGGETFISCPVNAVIHDSLAAFGKELSLGKKQFDMEKHVLETWEEVVDMGPDISSLSLDAEQVLKLEREQSRQLRVRDEFIRIASHELSTPLTSTKLALKRLEGMELPDKAGRSVAVMKRQVRRLEQLVTEMLDATRLQIGRLKLERTPVDLVELVRSVIDFLKSGDQPGAQEIELSGEASLVGQWDAARLDQVVTNLLINAIKYGEGRPINVEVSARDGHAQLLVRDRGIGISPEAIERIFDPFERAVPVETYGGLGLGLYIARCFVEMHGGAISVESVLNEGTTFMVELPIESSHEDNVIVELPIEQRETGT